MAEGLWLPDDRVRGNKLLSVLAILFPDYSRELSRLLGRAMASDSVGNEPQSELLLQEPTGEDWALSIQSRPKPSGRSAGPQILINIRPLPRKAAENLLLNSSRWLLDKYGEGLKLRFWHSDRDHRFTVVTNAPGRWGVTPDPLSMIGRTRLECAGTLDASAYLAWQHHLSQLESGITVTEFIYNCREHHGKETTWSVGAKPLRDENGEIEGYQGYALEVTDLWNARRDLNQSEASMLSLIDQLPLTAAVWTADWKLLRVSQRMSQLVKFPAAEMVGLSREQVQDLLGITTSSDGNSYGLEGGGQLLERRDQGDDKKVWLQTIIGKTTNGDRICVYTDATEGMESIANTRRHERLEQFGRFASSLAHDLSNVVAVIAGGMQAIRSRNPDDIEEVIGDIEIMLGTSRNMIQSLRSVASGLDRKASRDVDLNEELQQITRSFNHSTARAVEILPTRFKARINVDTVGLNRAMINLLMNAREACGVEGRITVQLERSRSPAANIGVTIEDDGPGWPVGRERELGNPMFSTKGSTRGFGLAQVMEFTAACGGKLTFGRSSAGGAKISMNLPGRLEEQLADQEASDDRPSSAPPALQTTANTSSVEARKFRVLVVDDDHTVRRMVTRVFKRIGWETFQAESGQKALSLIESMRQTVPDLVLTDVVMPGMSGLELAEKLADRYPNLLSVAAMSGHIPSGDPSGLPFLQKPFETEDVVLLLRSMGLP